MTILDGIRTYAAEAIEHALCAGLLDTAAADLPAADVVAAIAAVAREADLAPGGLAALFADDYWRDRDAFCRRMNTALQLAGRINGGVGVEH